MNCDELRGHYERYVRGVAEEPARSEIRAHLSRGCEVCLEGIDLARDSAALAGGREQRRFGWAPFLGLALALALFAAVYFGGRERDLAKELARVHEQNSRQNMELTKVNQAFAIVSAADTVATAFGEGPSKHKGKVYISPSQGLLLIAGNLPSPPSGKAYEMWIVKEGKAHAAGMFQPEADGSVMHIQRGRTANADAVAVTLEAEEGADQPTSTPVFTWTIPAPAR